MHILCGSCVSGGGREGCWRAAAARGGLKRSNGRHTDLVEAALVREDGDVSVVACASYMARSAVSTCAGKQQLLGEYATHQT
jgi:hypothetical protein